jgi:hypothetical protein
MVTLTRPSLSIMDMRLRTNRVCGGCGGDYYGEYLDCPTCAGDYKCGSEDRRSDRSGNRTGRQVGARSGSGN